MKLRLSKHILGIFNHVGLKFAWLGIKHARKNHVRCVCILFFARVPSVCCKYVGFKTTQSKSADWSRNAIAYPLLRLLRRWGKHKFVHAKPSFTNQGNVSWFRSVVLQKCLAALWFSTWILYKAEVLAFKSPRTAKINQYYNANINMHTYIYYIYIHTYHIHVGPPAPANRNGQPARKYDLLMGYV